jgi:hypothetical protein
VNKVVDVAFKFDIDKDGVDNKQVKSVLNDDGELL